MTTPRRQLLNYLVFLRESGALYLDAPPRAAPEPAAEAVPAAPARRAVDSARAPGAAGARAPAPRAAAPAANTRSRAPNAPAAATRAPAERAKPARAAAPPAPPPPPPGVDLPESERRLLLAEAAARAQACRACVLGERRIQAVYGVGSPMAKIMLVGEAPGADEDESGEPFVGKSGQTMTKMLKAAGFERSDVYICNTVKCRPPGNRPPLPRETEACRPFLLEQIRIVRPQMILAVGAHAAVYLAGKNVSMGKLREGNWHEFEGIPVIVTYHPAYLDREPKHKHEALRDLQELNAKYCELNPDDPRKIWKLGDPIPE